MKRTGRILVAVFLVVGLGTAAIAQQQRRQLTPEERAQRAEEQARRLEQEFATPRPIAALDSVWIEELTWMEVRDALAAGTRTAIVPTGGVEQNGPYLATGKHNYILQATCERIARRLGDALCAPILKLVPEGGIAEPSGSMLYPGTFSLRQETYEMVLDDIASSLRAHGFEHIFLIGDSGGNQRGLQNTAERLNERWGTTVAHYVPEYYQIPELYEYMETVLGVEQPGNDGLHDDYAVTSMMIAVDPSSVRFDQRVAAGKATINGVDITPLEKSIEIGNKLLDHRVDQTVAAIRRALGGEDS